MGVKELRSIIDEEQAIYRKGWNEALEACRQAQPVTAAKPDENTYQRGFFDGVIAYGRAILKLRS